MRSASSCLELTTDDGVRLVGTMTFPSTGEEIAAALLLNGSGPLDRDSNMRGQQLDVASSLAHSLAARGVASFRFDKRGVGESEGDYLTTSFDRETEDAAAALLVVRDAVGVDPARVSVVGHSVGATIAIRLAARYEWIGQVEPDDVEPIGDLIAGPFTGSTPDDLTHVLRKDSRRPSLATYSSQLRRAVDAELLETVSEWVSARSRRP